MKPCKTLLASSQFLKAGITPVLRYGSRVSLGLLCLGAMSSLCLERASYAQTTDSPPVQSQDLLGKSDKSPVEDSLAVQPSKFRGNPLSDSQVQRMANELSELINHFELTLASAGVFSDAYPRSSVELIQRLTETKVSSSQEAAFAIPPRYSGLVRSLHQAKQYRQSFFESVTQGEYSQANRAWVKAKNLMQDNFPTAAYEGAPTIKAIWLDRGTIVKAQSAADLKPLFDRMKRAGINVVFFETINAGYPIYPSDVAPQQNPLTIGWDPLEAAVKLAHEREMELHAWTWVFSAVNQKHNEILELPKDYPGPVLEKNPSWAIFDRNGDRPEWISGKSFMDPANPEVRDYLHRLFDEIVERYDVDGLQLDYIRYPFQNPRQGNIHGFSAEARRQFQQKYTVDPIRVAPGHRYWPQWLEFKTEKVDSFVQETSEKLKSEHPNLTISAAVFPMDYEIRHPNLQQNWQRWVKEGWVDLLLPMTYASSTEKFRVMTQPLFDSDSQGAALMLPGLRLLNMPSYKTGQQVQYVQQSPTPGYALFAAAHFQSALTSTLNRPSFRSAQKLLPHRQPIQAMALEYLGLKYEWHHWLSEAQNFENSDLTHSDFQNWAEESDQLSIVLDSLQEENDANLWNEAQVQLTQVKEVSQDWMMQSEVLPESLQQRWRNRLQRIQMLLTYAEKQHRSPASKVANAPAQ